jgi:hypothetical protein
LRSAAVLEKKKVAGKKPTSIHAALFTSIEQLGSHPHIVFKGSVFGLFDAFFELKQYRKNWPMKLGRGNKKFWDRSGLFPVHGPKFFVVQKG